MTAYFMGTSLTQRPGNQRPGTNSTNEFTLIPEKEQNLQKTSDMKQTREDPPITNASAPDSACEAGGGECVCWRHRGAAPPPPSPPKLGSRVGRRGAAVSVTQLKGVRSQDGGGAHASPAEELTSLHTHPDQQTGSYVSLRTHRKL